MGNKNPFSFYDFLGYLFPGVITIFLVFVVRQSMLSEELDFFDCLHVHNIIRLVKQEMTLNWLQASIGIIVTAYVVGHIVAYCSSLTIEYFAIKNLGYPSEFLLHKSKDSCMKLYYKNISKRLKWLRLMLALFLCPITLLLWISSEIGMRTFIQRTLDDYIVDAINTKVYHLASVLNLNRRSVNEKTDFHRIVMHYVYFNIPESQRKVDNYVAIYGFLRAMCFISVLFFDLSLFNALYSIRWVYEWYYNNGIVLSVNWFAVVVLVLMLATSFILFLAFVKFYRRFTLENFMALVTKKE